MRAASLLRTLLTAAAFAATGMGAMAQAPAPAYPAKAVHLTVANTPGSAPDLLVRYLAAPMADQWKQPIVVDNRPGAGGIVAAEGTAKAPADGYNLLVGADGPITILPNFQAGLPYNAQHDLVPVVSLGKIDFVLVANPKTGFHTLADFVNAAKAHPGQYNYASAGNGSPQQLGMEVLKQDAGIFVTHIPYRGGPLGMQDVIAGQVQVMFIAIGPALPQIKAGKLVALAVGGAQRHPLLPGVPTVAETYAGFRSGTWFGLFVPARTPQPVLDAITADTGRILHTPAARAALAAQGIDATGDAQPAFQQQIAGDYARYAQVARSVKISLE